MTIDVVWLEPAHCWDTNMLHQLFNNDLFPTGYEFTHHLRSEVLHEESGMYGCVLVIPGRYWNERTDEINAYVKQFQWVLGIRASDEENWFDVSKIVHRNIRWWIQTPDIRLSYGDVRKFGVGYPPHFNKLRKTPPDVGIDVFLSAQNTHPRRFDAFANMNCMSGMNLVQHQTAGFTQGLAHELYREYMIHSRVALAPGGPVSPDTFRLYEALEAHCVPIADDLCANYDSSGYWEMLFPDATFPIITNWQDSPGIAKQLVAGWPANANRVAAWWMRRKRDYVRWLREDLELLSAGLRWQEHAPYPITVVIPVSPIPSHPDISILEETIDSVRYWLPDSEVIVTFDGVRSEQEDMREAYEEAMRRTLWMCDHHWKNVTPLIFDEHHHQSGMMAATLQHIQTPLLMYVEQDMPLRTDIEIDFREIGSFILSGRSHLVRLYRPPSGYSAIPDEHQYLMHGFERGTPFLRTRQWSQNVHIASVDFYRRILADHFSAHARSFIENGIYHSVADVAPNDSFRLHIYHPQGDVRRIYHLDGRSDGPKFEETQVY